MCGIFFGGDGVAIPFRSTGLDDGLDWWLKLIPPKLPRKPPGKYGGNIIEPSFLFHIVLHLLGVVIISNYSLVNEHNELENHHF